MPDASTKRAQNVGIAAALGGLAGLALTARGGARSKVLASAALDVYAFLGSAQSPEGQGVEHLVTDVSPDLVDS